MGKGVGVLWRGEKTRAPGVAGPSGAGDDLNRAVLYMVFAAVLIPLLNASAKYLSSTYPVLEITWARYADHFAYMLIAFAPQRGLSLLASSRPTLQLVRSSLLCVSTLIFVMALRYVPLPTATAISFTSPFIVTALAPLLLGEAVGRYRWCAVVIGFLGALIVVRPGITGTNEAAFLIFGSALASALYQILSRKLAAHDEAETSITYIALAGFLITTVPLPFVWQTPASGFDCLVFLGLGLFGGFGHYFMVRAFELAPGSVCVSLQLRPVDRGDAAERCRVWAAAGCLGLGGCAGHRGKRGSDALCGAAGTVPVADPLRLRAAQPSTEPSRSSMKPGPSGTQWMGSVSA